MGTKINVWYPQGSNVGHASISILGTYMSWWPDAETKMKMYKEIFGFGGPGQAPSYQDDVKMEGKNPDWTGEYFGWERDSEAVEHWKTVYFSDFQRGLASRGKDGGAKYQFITNNCCLVVDKMLEKSGAYDWEVKLNLWRGMKGTLAPKDIATIGAYLGGQTGIINSPKMWSPIPEFWE